MDRVLDGKIIRVRVILWFKFDPVGIVKKVILVHDKRVILN